MMDVFDQDKSNEEPTPAAPVPAGPDVSQAAEPVQADQVSDDTPGVDDSAPSENEEDNES